MAKLQGIGNIKIGLRYKEFNRGCNIGTYIVLTKPFLKTIEDLPYAYWIKVRGANGSEFEQSLSDLGVIPYPAGHYNEANHIEEVPTECTYKPSVRECCCPCRHCC